MVTTMMAKLCAVVGAVILLLLFATVPVRASEVQLAWDPPSTDPEQAGQSNLAGYRLYYGLYDGGTADEFQAMIDIGQQPTYTVTGLTPGETYIFVVTAYDDAGNETDFSNVAVHSVPIPGEAVDPGSEAGEADVTANPDPDSALQDSADPVEEAAEEPAMDVEAAAAVESANAIGTADTVQDDWGNYRVSLTLESTNADDIGIMFRYQDADNYYRFSWNNQHMQRSLVKRHRGVFTLLAEDTQPAQPRHPYQLTIVALNELLEVWVDTTLVFSVRDTDLPTGPIALFALGNGDNYFDNLVAEDLDTSSVLVWNDFDDGRFADWMIVDEGPMTAMSEWSAEYGVLAQRVAPDYDLSGQAGSTVLGTYALYQPMAPLIP